ncbi:AIR synthase-related protein [Chloroflexota bacterium]
MADYGNRLSITTLNGAIFFDERYVANPLVFCGTLGLLPKKLSQSGQQQNGDLIMVIGGRTGRDGIHGVTFASEQLTEASGDLSFSSVQIGNPIAEKKFIDVLLQARDRRLYRRITDCGGGGLSSAVGEMAAETGARVDLDKVPLKYAGLSYTEIWISESQERMVLAVPPDSTNELLELFADEGVEAAIIGEFTNDRRLKLFYHGHPVGDLSLPARRPPAAKAGGLVGAPHPYRACLQPANRPGRGANANPRLMERVQQGMGHPPVRPRGTGGQRTQAFSRRSQ